MTRPGEHATSSRVILVVAGVSALLAAIVFRRWLSAEFHMLEAMGIIHLDVPTEASSPSSWFAFVHRYRAVGMLLLNAFDLVNYVLVAFAYFGIYSVLRQARRESMRLAIGLTVLGLSLYLASSQAFNLVSLSGSLLELYRTVLGGPPHLSGHAADSSLWQMDGLIRNSCKCVRPRLLLHVGFRALTFSHSGGRLSSVQSRLVHPIGSSASWSGQRPGKPAS
jgi:hypothetical protein